MPSPHSSARDLEAQVVLLGPATGGGDAEWCRSGAFSPSGTQLAVGQGSTAGIWDVATGTILQRLEHPEKVTDAQFSPDGRVLATGCQHETVRLWEVTSGQVLTVLPQTGTYPTFPSLAFSPDGRHLLTGDSAGAWLWNLASTKTPQQVAPRASEGWSVAYGPDGTHFAVSNASGTRIHDAATLAVLRTLERPDKAGPLAFSPDGATMATATWGETRIWDVTTGATRQGVSNPSANDDISALSFSPDGRLLATANWNHTARIWDVATADLMFTLIGHTSPVLSVAFTPDGRSVATCGDRSTRIWVLPER